MTLLSLGQQALPVEEFEVIVVDDGSSPPVPTAMGALGPRILRLEGEERSAARNAGAGAARGEVLVFIDDDVTVDSGFLAAHLEAQKEWPGVLAVGRVDLPREERERPFMRFRRSLESIPARRGLVAKDNFCTAQNMSIAREKFFALGGFSEEIVSGEDQDLALRHTAAGGRIAFLPEARGVHLDRALDIRSYCRRVEWGSEYIVPFCRRHPTWPDNIERELKNGPVRWSHQSLSDISKRLLKVPLSTKGPLALAFGMTRLLEKTDPQSAVLDALYRGLIGLHFFRGYQRGLKRFGPVPFPVCPAVERA